MLFTLILCLSLVLVVIAVYRLFKTDRKGGGLKDEVQVKKITLLGEGEGLVALPSWLAKDYPFRRRVAQLHISQSSFLVKSPATATSSSTSTSASTTTSSAIESTTHTQPKSNTKRSPTTTTPPKTTIITREWKLRMHFLDEELFHPGYTNNSKPQPQENGNGRNSSSSDNGDGNVKEGRGEDEGKQVDNRGGEKANPTVLLLHGNPTWSFLWRKVFAQVLMKKNIRVVCPDLIGFGLSDKPDDLSIHSLKFHVKTVEALVYGLGLREVTIVGQDWGGPIAAALARKLTKSDKGVKVSGLVLSNTTIRMDKNFKISRLPFHIVSRLWIISDCIFRGLNFPIPFLHLVQGKKSSIGKLQRSAYAFPFPSWKTRAGPLALARMVPWHGAHPTAITLRKVEAWARAWSGPVALVWGLKDPILGKQALAQMREIFPGALVVESEAGHFLQEEVPERISAAITKIAFATYLYKNKNK